jgi:hypothetical protein
VREPVVAEPASLSVSDVIATVILLAALLLNTVITVPIGKATEAFAGIVYV